MKLRMEYQRLKLNQLPPVRSDFHEVLHGVSLPLKLNQLPPVKSDFHETLHGVSAPKIESTLSGKVRFS